MNRTRKGLSAILLLLMGMPGVANADWPRFRGPAGSGIAEDSNSLPTQWSSKANLAWKTPLPGPGASSPIIVGNKVFLTCYSGYGTSRDDPGEQEDLVRHLVCLDLQTGTQLWQQDVEASLPEDPYIGSGVSSHGYASHTPVSDGVQVYAFFGKSGVHAFDLNGNKLWSAEVGQESDPPRWGSSSSPIVHDDTLIVTASAESQAVVGFDTSTGEERWRQEATGLDGMWGTPILVKVDEQRSDVVMFVPNELWGLDPQSGKLRWFADALGSQQAYASVIADGKRVFLVTGLGGGSLEVEAGGFGDVSESHTMWTGRTVTTYATPVRYQSKLYVISRGILSTIDADSGTLLHQFRLEGAQETGGPFGSLDYASPILVGDRLLYLNASGQVFVYRLEDQARLIAVNRVTQDKETFWGSPAVSQGRLIMRSSHHVYCVADLGDVVKPEDNLLPSNDEVDEIDDGMNDRPRDATEGSQREGASPAVRRGTGRSRPNASSAPPRPKRPLRPESAGG